MIGLKLDFQIQEIMMVAWYEKETRKIVLNIPSIIGLLIAISLAWYIAYFNIFGIK